ncbi:MAG TPA: hypothetical protein VNQ81_06430 [Povalibacter sp.]|nr:hypothetical protein [Povalibacter sp.]
MDAASEPDPSWLAVIETAAARFDRGVVDLLARPAVEGDAISVCRYATS